MTRARDLADLISSGVIEGTEVADDAITYAKIQNVTATDKILGRDSAGAGIVEEISPASLRTMINVEDGSTADQSNAEIKTAYEANSDTNEFSDAEQTKLSGIATSANNYVHPNHTGEVTSTADGATVVADDIIDEANLKSDNSPTNDYVLTAKSSASGGLTWAEAGGGLDGVTTGSGNVTISNGNLIVGTAGKGIDFSAQTPSSASNATTQGELLAHYEEGQWTPTVWDAKTGGTEVSGYYFQYGRYTRVGNLCRVSGTFYITNEGSVTAGNTIWIRDLPFAPVNETGTDGGGQAFHQNSQSGFTEMRVWISRDNGAVMTISKNAGVATTGWSNATFNDLDTNFNFGFSIMMRTVD